MTFDELNNELPNGFHDAELHSLSIDYVRGTAILNMALDFGTRHGPKTEDYKLAELRVSGLYFCVLDPPDPNYRFVPRGSPLSVSGDPAKPNTFPALEKLLQSLPAGVSCYRFFVHEWNSFINIAAKDVHLLWLAADRMTLSAPSSEQTW